MDRQKAVTKGQPLLPHYFSHVKRCWLVHFDNPELNLSLHFVADCGLKVTLHIAFWLYLHESQVFIQLLLQSPAVSQVWESLVMASMSFWGTDRGSHLMAYFCTLVYHLLLGNMQYCMSNFLSMQLAGLYQLIRPSLPAISSFISSFLMTTVVCFCSGFGNPNLRSCWPRCVLRQYAAEQWVSHCHVRLI